MSHSPADIFSPTFSIPAEYDVGSLGVGGISGIDGEGSKKGASINNNELLQMSECSLAITPRYHDLD